MTSLSQASDTKRIGIVLAAGKGTRMKSDLAKVLHPILAKPMLQRVLEALVPLDLSDVFVIVGHQSDEVEAAIRSWSLPLKITCIKQEPQLGTGHAVQQVLPHLSAEAEADVLITCGDMPLIPTERYASLLQAREIRSDSPLALATVWYEDPTGYGRVFWSEETGVSRIVEHKDATDQQRQHQWGNTGIYAGHWPTIAKYLDKLEANNAQQEFYLPDIVQLLHDDKQLVQAVQWPDEEEVLGINSRQQLAQAVSYLSKKTADRLMADGVTIHQPCSSLFAPEIQVGYDSTIYPGCVLEGDIVVGSHSEIGPQTTCRSLGGRIQIGAHCRIVHAHLERDVRVSDKSYIGPYAHLRDNADIGEQCRIGNFVEVKEARIGNRSNAAHLAYLGDVTLGDDVNMGAGSIIANYDPIRDSKTRSELGDKVKVGCNSVIVSPVKVDEGACVAAGSVITEDVPAWDLAIARNKQSTKPGWVKTVLEDSKEPV